MFGKSNKPSPIDSLIGAGTTVKGDIVFVGGLRIDGQVTGNVATADGQAGTLVISEHARVDGDIRVSHIVVNGTVNGPVSASDYLELQPKARVTAISAAAYAGAIYRTIAARRSTEAASAEDAG